MEQYINQLENFEPSTSTKFRWLRIRKSENGFNPGTNHHFIMPGYFNFNEQYGRDRRLFFAAIILEIWGLSNILLAGSDSPLILVGVPIAFLFDIFFAISSHWYAGKQCETKNNIFLAQAEKQNAKIKGFKTEFNNRKFIKYVSNSFIVLICFAKITVFYGLNEGFDLLTFGITFSYIIVAIIHIYITGYFIAEVDFRLRLRSEKNQNEYEETQGRKHEVFAVTNERAYYQFASNVPLKECKDAKQKLVLISNEKNKYKYAIHTWGVLLDYELNNLIYHQEPENKIIVASHGLTHQIQIRQSAAQRSNYTNTEPLISPKITNQQIQPE